MCVINFSNTYHSITEIKHGGKFLANPHTIFFIEKGAYKSPFFLLLIFYFPVSEWILALYS